VELDDELKNEGLGREIVSKVQSMRKELGLEFVERVRLHLSGSAKLEAVAKTVRELLATEALADVVTVGDEAAPTARAPGIHESRALTLEGEELMITLTRTTA
jgi:isoleucyl-tRNA synthetase